MQTNPPDWIIRKACPADHPAYAQLFPELLVDDPIPSSAVWVAALMPSTWVAVRNEQVLGYCYFQEYQDTGYVRNVVVAKAARRSGVGRALMNTTADYLRARGKTSWRLNVRANNRAALALYERTGMSIKYAAKSLRFPWAALDLLPSGTIVTCKLTEDRDAALETCFELPRGQLAAARNAGRVLLEASSGAASVGLSVFNPQFPGAFPFRVKELAAARALLVAMRQHVPSDEHVLLMVEDDARLEQLLESVGATVRDEVLHLAAAL